MTDGGRYDPGTDMWTPTIHGNQPSARRGHRAVWTGNHMIVWGDDFGATTGGKYDPALDSWSPTTVVNAPTGRSKFSMVWAGDRMIVWGGNDGGGTAVFDTGARYDPFFDTWTPTSTIGAPASRQEHTAVWTGSTMIVWGGERPFEILGTGGQYDPISDTWTATGTASAPTARFLHVGQWTGSRMLIWGGRDSSFTRLQSGSRYDPIANTWSSMSQTGAPSGREDALSAWSGDKLLVWGGFASSGSLVDGGRYDPASNAWSSMSSIGVPSKRCVSAATWAGDRMLIWGGYANCSSQSFLNTGAQYFPASDTWSPMSTTGAASPRAWTTMVWTGSAAIVWGGEGETSNVNLSSGGRWIAGDQRDDDGDGFTECGGDCNDGNAAVHPGASDVCDGIDNDCDGTVDNGVIPPASVSGLVAGPLKDELHWSPVAGADRYDVVSGDLTALRAGNGDFTHSLSTCLESDSPSTAADDPATPDVDSCIYYLVRAKAACKLGSYSQWTGAERPGRDAQISLSPVACP
jgi:N-acetylneuraminic acid mutarotase